VSHTDIGFLVLICLLILLALVTAVLLIARGNQREDTADLRDELAIAQATAEELHHINRDLVRFTAVIGRDFFGENA
jgi:Tfp pilus assembly protein PilV